MRHISHALVTEQTRRDIFVLEKATRTIQHNCTGHHDSRKRLREAVRRLMSNAWNDAERADLLAVSVSDMLMNVYYAKHDIGVIRKI